MKTSLNTKGKKGFSLVEVMIAVLLLTIMALGGAAFMQRAGSTVTIQKSKRAAIIAASRRLEQLRTEPFDNINDSPVGALWYIDGANNVVTDKPAETVSINGRQRPFYVEIQRFSESSPTREYVRATVYVQYREGGNWVSLTTNLR